MSKITLELTRQQLLLIEEAVGLFYWDSNMVPILPHWSQEQTDELFGIIKDKLDKSDEVKS